MLPYEFEHLAQCNFWQSVEMAFSYRTFVPIMEMNRECADLRVVGRIVPPTKLVLTKRSLNSSSASWARDR